MKSLEAELGYALFFRDSDRLRPTDHCARLLTDVEAAAEALHRAEQKSATVETATVWRDLRITAPPFLVTTVFAPAVADLARLRKLRVEMLAPSDKAAFIRREIDISLQIDDRPAELKVSSARIAGDHIGDIHYAVYAGVDVDFSTLPWAGLSEQYAMTSGSEVMSRLAGKQGFRFQARHFATLLEFAASGVACAMLPCCMVSADTRLQQVSDVVLSHKLWMLFHSQDRDVPHLRSVREWSSSLSEARLS